MSGGIGYKLQLLSQPFNITGEVENYIEIGYQSIYQPLHVLATRKYKYASSIATSSSVRHYKQHVHHVSAERRVSRTQKSRATKKIALSVLMGFSGFMTVKSYLRSS